MKHNIRNIFFWFFVGLGTMNAQHFNTTSYQKELNSVELGIRPKKVEPVKIQIDTVYVNKEIEKEITLDDEDIETVNIEYSSSTSRFSFPLESFIVKSTFGLRKHPISGVWKNHNGIDLKANYEDVKSVLNGVVVASGWSERNGNYLAIKTNNYVLYYLHLEEYYFQTKEIVNSGAIIGVSGTTGHSTAPHLHFAVKRNNKWVNPIDFLTELNKIYLASNF